MWESINGFISGLSNGDKAGWAQAIGTVLAIFASGWIANRQSKTQYKNSLKLQDMQDKNKELVLTESVVQIIKNSAVRAKHVCSSFKTRQDVYDIANKVKYYDFDGLTDVIESLKQIPLKDLPSANLVTDIMVLISSLRQLSVQVDKAIFNNRTMNDAEFATFFQVLLQIKDSAEKTYNGAQTYLDSIKEKFDGLSKA